MRSEKDLDATVPGAESLYLSTLAAWGFHHELEGGRAMPEYLYQVAYTSESLAAQIKNPQDRLELVGKQITDAVGARRVAGGSSYGEYDISVIVDASDGVTMAAVALAIAAGGAVRAAKTTPLLSGRQWMAALRKAPAVSAQYRPAR
jgi:uncharacterized protein with GYD domain